MSPERSLHLPEGHGPAAVASDVVPRELEGLAWEAMELCPTGAIRMVTVRATDGSGSLS